MANDSWQPFGRITTVKVDVDPNVIWPLGYEPEDSYKIPDRAGKFYRAARVELSPPKQKLKFSTPAQAEFNAGRETCPRCKGRGATRKDINIGCTTCLGRGSVEA